MTRARALRKIAGAAWHASRAPSATTVGAPPLVSVIVATYNWSAVLHHAIASVRRQTYARWELLVVGDACTDDSAAVVAAFADERISWRNLSQNSGNQSGPNNAGLAEARGDYIAYLGHDDLWHPDHLAILMRRLRRGHADIAAALTMTLGPAGSRFRLLQGLAPPGDYVPPSSIVHRAAIARQIGGWRDYREIALPPDADFMRRAHQHGAIFTSVPALTVFKFPSALRANSYRDRPSHEQARYAERMVSERAFIHRELAALGALRLRRAPTRIPQLPPRPDPLPPGWEVTQYRRIRGLE